MRIATAIFVLSAVGILAADDTKKDDAELLKGKWKAVSISMGGDPQPDELVKDFKMSFDGKEYTNTAGDMVEEGAYTIDASKSPKTIDFDIKKGPDKDKKQLGVYKMENDKLTIVAKPAGSNERPKSLDIEKGSDLLQVVLERIKRDGSSSCPISHVGFPFSVLSRSPLSFSRRIIRHPWRTVRRPPKSADLSGGDFSTSPRTSCLTGRAD